MGCRHRLRTSIAFGLGAILLAGCGASAGRFASAAESYIEGKEVATWGKQAAFSNAVCTEPESTAVNTEFQCTADGSDGFSYVFQVLITGERKFKIESLQPQG